MITSLEYRGCLEDDEYASNPDRVHSHDSNMFVPPFENDNYEEEECGNFQYFGYLTLVYFFVFLNSLIF